MRVRAHGLPAGAVLAAALAIPGMLGAGEVIIRVAPPVPRHEVIITAPSLRHIWVPGYWNWSGTAYVWVPGAWQLPPRPHVHWVPGHYRARRRGWIWIPGHWR
jgi:hypothetical protein